MQLQLCQPYYHAMHEDMVNVTQHIPRCCVDPAHNMTSTSDPEDCPVSPCWHVIHANVNSILKMVGGVGLFFSFTEVCIHAELFKEYQSFL